MTAATKDKSSLEVKLSLEVSAQELAESEAQKTNQVMSQAQLKGFRKGRVPRAHIARLYGKQIRAEVLEKSMQSVIQNAFADSDYQPLAQPKVQITQDKPGQDFCFDVTFENMPIVDADRVKTIQLKQAVAKIEEDDIDQALQKIKLHFASWNEVERKTKHQDRITVDFMGVKKGEDSTDIKDQSFILGENTMPDELNKQLLGKSRGDEVMMTSPFPNTTDDDTKINVVIKRIEEAQLPQMDAEFARKIGIKFEDGQFNEQMIIEETQKPLEREKDSLINKVMAKRVLDALYEAYEHLPESQDLFDEYLQAMAQQESDKEKRERISALTSKSDDAMVVDAKKWARLQMILMGLRKHYEINIDEHDIMTRAKDFASQYADDQAFFKWLVNDTKRMAQFKEELMQEALVDKVLQDAQTQEEAFTFESLRSHIQEL